MNKAELVQSISQDAGISLKEAGAALDTFLEVVRSSLKKGDEIRLTGFGTFKTVKRAARQGVNPATGEKIKIKARTVPKFVAGKELKDIIG